MSGQLGTLTWPNGAIVAINGYRAKLDIEPTNRPTFEARYGAGWQNKYVPGTAFHPGLGHDTLGLSVEQINEMITAGAVPAALSERLLWAGWTAGSQITALDRRDLKYFRGQSGRFTVLREVLDLMQAAPGSGEDGAGGGLMNYAGAPPLTGPNNVYDRLLVFGLIDPANDRDHKFFATKYYENKLVPGVNEEQWMLSERGLRPLPERAIAPLDGIELFRKLEKAVGAYGLAKAEGKPTDNLQAAALEAYWQYEEAWVPDEFIGPNPSFGDREYNPRTLFHRSRKIENGLTLGNPTSAAVSGPRVAMALGWPQVLSLFEGEGMRQTLQEMQVNEWRMYLGLPIDGSQAGPGVYVGGRS